MKAPVPPGFTASWAGLGRSAGQPRSVVDQQYISLKPLRTVFRAVKVLRQAVAGLLLLLLFAQLVLAEAPKDYLRVVGSAWIVAPAVYQADSGYAGSLTNITVFVTEGWGDVYVSTSSLTQEDFQGAATAAARVVSKLLNVDFSRYNFYFKVKSDSVIVGGPSAGVAMAVAVYSALTGAHINRSVAVTGMISPDGSVGPVGGVYEKAQAVAQYGAKVFLVPPGQSVVTTYREVVRRVGPFRIRTFEPQVINLTEYAARNLGLKVVEISTLEDAIRYFFGVPIEKKPVSEPVLTTVAKSRVASVISRLWDLASSEYNATSSYLESSGLSTLAKRALRSYLDTAASQLSKARSAGSSPAAAFFYTSSLAYSRWVRYLVDYYLDRPLESTVSAVSERVQRLLDQVEGLQAASPVDLSCKVLAADLAVRASRLLNESAATWASDPVSALQSLASASALADEAEAWASALVRGAPAALPSVPESYISVARSTWSYVYSVLSQAGGDMSLVSLSNTYLRASMSLYSSGKRFLASVAAARSIALSEAALLQLQLSATGSRVYLSIAREHALEAASELADNIPAAYFLSLGDAAPSDSDKLTYYRVAAQLGSLTADISKQLGTAVTSQPPSPQQPQPAAPQQPATPPERPRSILDQLRDFLARIALALESFFKWLKQLLGWG